MSIEFYEHFDRAESNQSYDPKGVSQSNPAGVAGPLCWQLSSVSGTMFFQLPNAGATKKFHLWFRGNSHSSADVKIFVWHSGTTELGSVRVNAGSLHFQIYTGTATLQDTGDALISDDTWYHLLLTVTIGDSGSLELKVNGVVDASFSGDTQPGSETTIDRFGILYSTGAGTAYFDDVIVDTANSLGMATIKFYRPTGQGNYTAMTGTYADVDDPGINDGDTTKLTSVSNGDKESVTFGAHGLDAASTILAVGREVIAKGTNASIKTGYRIGGVDYMGSEHVLSGSYAPIVDISELNPADSNPFETTDLVPELVMESVI